jgi:hypothetical protein
MVTDLRTSSLILVGSGSNDLSISLLVMLLEEDLWYIVVLTSLLSFVSNIWFLLGVGGEEKPPKSLLMTCHVCCAKHPVGNPVNTQHARPHIHYLLAELEKEYKIKKNKTDGNRIKFRLETMRGIGIRRRPRFK